jgi:hypothetical protein
VSADAEERWRQSTASQFEANCAQFGCYKLLCYCGNALYECPHDGPKQHVYSGDHRCGACPGRNGIPK